MEKERGGGVEESESRQIDWNINNSQATPKRKTREATPRLKDCGKGEVKRVVMRMTTARKEGVCNVYMYMRARVRVTVRVNVCVC